MGVQSLSQERISNVEDCLMLDVLQKNLSVPKIFPALPGEDELYVSLLTGIGFDLISLISG
jgi:hypothetical protein